MQPCAARTATSFPEDGANLRNAWWAKSINVEKEEASMAIDRNQLPDATVDFRTVDGANNNPANPGFNAANTDFARIGEANFADGVSTLVEGPNPRTISNLVVGEGDAAVANQEGLSGFMYAWGQFIDHDLDLSRTDGKTHIDVQVPAGDPNFPDGSSISITRAVIDPATGAGTGQPATAVNSITGGLDASMDYGSDAATGGSVRLPA